jgi:hypothetical protein
MWHIRGRRKMYTVFWWGNLMGRYLEDLDIDWRIVLGSNLVQDRDKWQVLVNMVINLWVPQNAGNFLTS